MPRNPDKARCIVPGCQNWAMRDRERCRPHRDAELGPRGAGAPLANLNALRIGDHSHPLSLPKREQLVAAILADPDALPLHVGLVVRSIHTRTRDPFLTLVALGRLLSQLIPLLAACLFRLELQAYLRAALRRSPAAEGLQGAPEGPLPALVRDLQAQIERTTPRQSPEERLLFLRKVLKHREQLPEPGSDER